MKAPSPAFSVYPKDIDSDENCKVMDLREFGAYMRLILHSWTEGSIPTDPDRLAKILGVTRRTFDAVWPNVSPCFAPSPDDSARLQQRRLEKERDKQAQRAYENAENGKKGGRPRKSRDSNETGNRTLSDEKPTGSVSESETKGRARASSPSPSPSSTEQLPPSSSVDSRPETAERSDAAGEARAEVVEALDEWRKRNPNFDGGERDNDILANVPEFHAPTGPVRLASCENVNLLRATAAKIRAHGRPKAQQKKRNVSREFLAMEGALAGEVEDDKAAAAWIEANWPADCDPQTVADLRGLMATLKPPIDLMHLVEIKLFERHPAANADHEAIIARMRNPQEPKPPVPKKPELTIASRPGCCPICSSPIRSSVEDGDTVLRCEPEIGACDWAAVWRECRVSA